METHQQTIAQSLREALEAFCFEGKVLSAQPYGNGHINDTFLVVCEGGKRYILQRMNTHIFKNPQGLIDNIERVTDYLRDKIVKQGGDPARETLRLIDCRKGGYLFRDSEQRCFRAYDFVEGTVCYEKVESAEDFYRCAQAFGQFQRRLADFPAQCLCEPIPDFHNTPARYEQLEQAVAADVCGRVGAVAAELAFVRARKEETRVLYDRWKSGALPLRVTHNDTKLNNILFDSKDGRALCIIDLDTVMPGFAVTDFGDSIRFGANTAAEDERDLKKVSLDLSLFEAYTRGFADGCAGSLTAEEAALLPMGAKLMTLECGMRFLTDYISGDTYFRIHRPDHNLDRCRTQLALVRDMEQKWEEMNQAVRRCMPFSAAML